MALYGTTFSFNGGIRTCISKHMKTRFLPSPAQSPNGVTSPAFIHIFTTATTSFTSTLSRKHAPLSHFLIGMDRATPFLIDINVTGFWWHIAHCTSHLQAIIFAPTNVKISLIPTLVYLQQLNVITQSRTIRKVRYCIVSSSSQSSSALVAMQFQLIKRQQQSKPHLRNHNCLPPLKFQFFYKVFD